MSEAGTAPTTQTPATTPPARISWRHSRKASSVARKSPTQETQPARKTAGGVTEIKSKKQSRKAPLFLSFAVYSPNVLGLELMRWCTVTVSDPDGRRYSVDVQATSTFDPCAPVRCRGKKGTRRWLAEANARHHIRSRCSGKELSCDGRPAPAVDRGEAQFVETPERLSVLPKAWPGIMESTAHAREDL